MKERIEIKDEIKEEAIVEEDRVLVEKEEKISEEIKKSGDRKEAEELLEQRKKRVIGFFKKSNWIIYGILAIILWINIRIRSLPISGLKDVTTGGYTLGPDLDPWLFLRYAKEIVANGSLPAIDYMRYVPLGYNTSGETKLLPYMIAYLYKFISLFSKTTVEYAAIIFPIVFSIITTIFFFLLVRKIFEDKGRKASIIAIISTAFFVILPSLLPRTIAGIPEKESAGFGLMFIAFYFFLSGWKSENIRKGLIFSFLAGLFTALMGLVWGGWIFVFTVIGGATLIAFLIGKVRKKEFIVYFVWFIFSLFIPTIFFTERYHLKELISSHSIGLSVFVLFVLAIDLLIFHTKIKELNIVRRFSEKISDKLFSLIFSLILILIFSTLLFGISFIPNLFSGLVGQLTSPYDTRLMFTVAENRQPYFDEWRGSFGPVLRNIPLFFWLFFIGSIFLFYDMTIMLKKKDKLILISIYVIFLFSLIFSRYSPESILNGTNALSKILYFGGGLLFFASFIYFYYKAYKNKETDIFKKINFSYLFLFILFFISLIAARSAIRLIMVLTPVGAIIVSYLNIIVLDKALKKKEGAMKILVWLLVIVIVLGSVFTFYRYYQESDATAKNYVPSSYNVQWQKAMSWVRNNTEKDAVFGHWWDYGYWVQSIGERATMLDGGNAISYWNYLMGRHVLTSPDEKEALELLYAHNVSYYLIDSTEIGKYSAYSNIGSDENYDRYSWIGTFLLNEQATKETREESYFVYQGGTALDEDFLYKTEENQILMPSGMSGVGALILRIENNSAFKQPKAVFVYQGRQYEIPLRYLYYKGELYDFKEGYEGGLYILPRVIPQGQGVSVNEKGAALFLSERNMRALWIKLYLLEEGEHFKLVHNEPSLIVESLRNQGIEVGDFLFYQGIHGPIKIWEISYTGNEKINPEYIQEDYPERIKQRKYAK